MKSLLKGALLCALLLLAPAAYAQIPPSGGSLVGGVTPVTGNCTSGYFMYNNAGLLGCSAGSSSIGFPQAITGGVSGGIPFFSSTTQLSASALLTANEIVLGGGVGFAPAVLGSLGTATTVLHGNVSGAPSFGAVNLATDVTGNLPISNLNSGTGATSSSFWRGDGTWAAPPGAVASFSYTCPATGPLTGAVSFANGVPSEHETSYTVQATDCGYVIETSTATTMPAVPSVVSSGFNVTIFNISGSSPITITGTINGGSSLSLPSQTAVRLVVNASNNGFDAFFNGAGGGSSGLTVGTTTISGGTNGYIEYNNSGVLGELATTGSGNVVQANSPTLVTPNLGMPSALDLTNALNLPISTGLTGSGLNVLTTLQAAVNASGGIVSPTPAAAGDVIYWNGSAWVKLAGNASGTVYLSESSAGVPSWSSGAGSGVSSFSTTCPASGPSTGAVTLPLGIVEVPESTGFTPTAGQCGAWFDVTGTTTATLPTITGSIVSPYFITIKNADVSGHTVTVAGGGANINYNGSSTSSITLSAGQSVGLVINAANTAWAATGTVVGSPPSFSPGYISGDWYFPSYPGQAGLSGSGSVVASTVYCGLAWVPSSVTIKSLGAYFATGTTSSHVSFAIFNASGGRPNTLIDYVAPVAIPTSSNNPANGSLNNVSDTLAQVVYFLCSSQDTAAAVMYSLTITGAAGAGGGAAWVGSPTISVVINGSAALNGVSCTAASTCGTGYAAWSTGSFTWASFTTATWSNVTTISTPVIVMQAN